MTMTTKTRKRREFLKSGAIAFAAPYFIPSVVFGKSDKVGANDKIHLGVIGSGGRSRALTGDCPAGVKIVSVADCDLRRSASYLSTTPKYKNSVVAEKCSRYQDYREMLEKEKLDGVFVGTPTHSRALACMHAMMAGLDVYAEKPLTLTIEEGQYLTRAEKKLKRVFQVGTQQRSIAINNFGCDLVKNGAIGKVQTVHCLNFRGPKPRPKFPHEPTPPEMNWDLWCDQTELIPFSSKLHPAMKWRWYRDYCGGDVTGWVHAFDQVQCALGTDATGPVEVWPIEKEKNTKVFLRYASGTVLKLDLDYGKGPQMGGVFVGEKGKIEINRNRLASNPTELIKDAPPPEIIDRPVLAKAHIANWLDCMRTREKTVATASIGHRATTVCHLINICRELGRKLQWNPGKEEFIGDDEANALRSRPRRKGYELPKV